jgi:DNA-binding IclR family transcriptional regulator
MKNNVKERIIEALREHPEGLTRVEIAKIIGSHRHTVTKYIYELVGKKLVYQREVGTAKLCYLKVDKK